MRVFNSVKMITTSAGTGPLVIGNAAAGGISALEYGDPIKGVWRLEWGAGSFEIFIGELAYDSAADNYKISRDIVIGSSAAGAAQSLTGQANLPSGSKTVQLVVVDFCLPAVEPHPSTLDDGGFLPPDAAGEGAVALGHNAVAGGDIALAIGPYADAPDEAALALYAKSRGKGCMVVGGSLPAGAASKRAARGFHGRQVIFENTGPLSYLDTLVLEASDRVFAETTIFIVNNTSYYLGTIKYVVLAGTLTIISAQTQISSNLGSPPAFTLSVQTVSGRKVVRFTPGSAINYTRVHIRTDLMGSP